MNRISQKLTNLPLYALLSSILGVISGSIAIITVIIALSGSLDMVYGFDWIKRSPSYLAALVVGGLLILVGSWLIAKGKYGLGATFVLLFGMFSSYLGMPIMTGFLDYYASWLRFNWLSVIILTLALPTASCALALSVKKKTIIAKEGMVLRKLAYRRASAALGLTNGTLNVIAGFLILGTWYLGVFAPFLIVGGLLMIYGGYCISQKKFVRGMLLILVPGFFAGFLGIPLLMIAIMSRLRFYPTNPWDISTFALGIIAGFAFPLASWALAINSRE